MMNRATLVMVLLLPAVATAEDSTIAGKAGWRFFAPEVRHLEADAAPQTAAQAIVDFKRQLDRAGVELLLVPVPAKASVYPEHLAAPVRDGAAGKRLLASLAEQGVKILDLAPIFTAAKARARAPLYCRTDTHWSGEGCLVAARAIAEAAKARGWYAALPRKTFEGERRTVEITGDLRRGPDVPRESVSLRSVGTRESGRLVPVAPDRASPVLLVGDSHNLIFHAGGDMFAVGAGLPDQLALELGFPVDVLAVRGSGATPARTNLARRARADGAYLRGKKLVIWCFSVRELTQSAWQNVSLFPAAGGS